MDIEDDIWVLDEDVITATCITVPDKPDDGLVEQVVKEDIPKQKVSNEQNEGITLDEELQSLITKNNALENKNSYGNGEGSNSSNKDEHSDENANNRCSKDQNRDSDHRDDRDDRNYRDGRYEDRRRDRYDNYREDYRDDRYRDDGRRRRRRKLRLVGSEIIDIDITPFIIGKSRNCDYSIPDQVISRKHIKIFYEDGDYYVKDLGSTNNTYLDGRVIHEARLHDGQELMLADRRFIVELF